MTYINAQTYYSSFTINEEFNTFFGKGRDFIPVIEFTNSDNNRLIGNVKIQIPRNFFDFITGIYIVEESEVFHNNSELVDVCLNFSDIKCELKPVYFQKLDDLKKYVISSTNTDFCENREKYNCLIDPLPYHKLFYYDVSLELNFQIDKEKLKTSRPSQVGIIIVGDFLNKSSEESTNNLDYIRWNYLNGYKNIGFDGIIL